MFACPTCNERAIRPASKFHATQAAPAICSACDGRFAEPGGLAIALPLAWLFGVLVSIQLAIHWTSWWPIPAGLCLLALLEGAAFRLAPLHAVSARQEDSSRRRLVVFSVVVVSLLCLLQIVGDM